MQRPVTAGVRASCRGGRKTSQSRLLAGAPGLQARDPLGLRALLALRHDELDPLPLVEAAIPAAVNRRVVNEDVGPAVVLGDETEALLGVEPFDGALSHVALLLTGVDPVPRLRAGDAAKPLPSPRASKMRHAR